MGLQLLSEEKFPVLHNWIEKLSNIDVVENADHRERNIFAYISSRFEALIEALIEEAQK